MSQISYGKAEFKRGPYTLRLARGMGRQYRCGFLIKPGMLPIRLATQMLT